jgi:hypothetical protein
MKKTTEMVVRKLNAHIQERIIDRGDPDFSIICDASLKVWGAIFQTQSINGRWSEKEQYFHINYLQLLAIFFALKSFCRDFYSKHVHIFCDNTSAVAYINNMGGIQSHEMDFLASKIWQWCIDRKIWISCSHVAGDSNKTDFNSRHFCDNTEWKLDSSVFFQVNRYLGQTFN